MKNTLWLYKNPYQIEIRENEAHPPQVAVYLYEAEKEIKNVVLTGGGSVSSLWEKSVLLDGDRLCHVLKTVYSYFVSLIYVFHFLS